MKLLLFLLLTPILCAQVPSWPPGGVTPSATSPLLPDGRFVPSTKRWNLVWADQIVPGWVTPGKVEFAAKNYIGTQKIFASQAEQFRQFDTNFLILTYHLAAGLNPEHNADAPDPKSNDGEGFIGVVAPAGYVAEIPEYFRPWLAQSGIVEGSSRYEEMFQHYDVPDSLHRVWHQDPYWLMDIANADWRAYLGDVVLEWMGGNGDDGCFFDVAVEMNVSLYNPRASNPAPRDFNWWQSPHGPVGAVGTIPDYSEFDDWMNPRYLRYFQELYRRFHTAVVDYLVIPNVDQMVTTVYDPVWLDGDDQGETIDGAMMEGFGSYRGSDMWLTLERGLRHITGRGKILIAQFGADTPEERLRRTAMYMLIRNDNSFINIINSGNVEWYPEYEIDLGDAAPLPESLESMRIAGSGSASLWRRDYEQGMVLCNTSDAPISYDPPGDGWARLVTSGGGDVNDDGTPPARSIESTPFDGAVVVGPSDGVILSRAVAPTSVDFDAPESSEEGGLSVVPNPVASGFRLSLDLSCGGATTVSLIDLLGRTVVVPLRRELSAGRHVVECSLPDLPNGWYLCRLQSSCGVREVPVRIER